jgi:hypothetical protein
LLQGGMPTQQQSWVTGVYLPHLAKFQQELASAQTRLKSQLKLDQAPPEGLLPGQAPGLPHYSQLVHWQEGIKQMALRAIDGEMPASTATARLVMGTCMLCMLYGHTSMAQRSSAVLTAKASMYATTKCQHPTCFGLGKCHGNRFVKLPGGGFSISLPHYKSQGETAPGVVVAIKDADEAKLLHSWEGTYRGLLVDQDEPPENAVQLQFFQPFALTPFTESGLCHWFKEMQRKHTAPWLPSVITPHQLRDAAVAYSRANPDEVDPEAAAKLMGHSSAQWATYDKGKGGRLVHKGQTQLVTLRGNMLVSCNEAGGSGLSLAEKAAIPVGRFPCPAPLPQAPGGPTVPGPPTGRPSHVPPGGPVPSQATGSPLPQAPGGPVPARVHEPPMRLLERMLELSRQHK